MSSEVNSNQTHEQKPKSMASSASHDIRDRELRANAQPLGQTSNSATGVSRLPKNVRNNSEKEVSAMSKPNPISLPSLPNSHSQSAIYPVLNEVFFALKLF